MLKFNFPTKYELIPGSLYISDPNSKYKTDPLYNETSDPVKYEQFLNNLFQNSKPSQKRYLDTIKNFIVNYTTCVTAPLDSPRYFYSRSKIIINLPDSKTDRISLILGSSFFYIVGITSLNVKQIYIPSVSKIVSYLITKVSTRPIDYSELTPRVIQYLIAWWLRKYDSLTAQNLSKYSIKAGKGFITPKDLRDVLDTVKNLRDVNQFFDLIEQSLNINTFKQAFIARYGIDVLLTFDDIGHLLYNIATSFYLRFPAILYQYISRSVVRKDSEKLAVSIASRLHHKLPKF